jgi:hypothetical protein
MREPAGGDSENQDERNTLKEAVQALVAAGPITRRPP